MQFQQAHHQCWPLSYWVFSATFTCQRPTTLLAQAPILFGAGFHSLQSWWKIGFIFSLIVIPVFIFVGGAWWKLLGLW
ncbi:anion permease [Vibrio sp. M60_M31a]